MCADIGAALEIFVTGVIVGAPCGFLVAWVLGAFSCRP